MRRTAVYGLLATFVAFPAAQLLAIGPAPSPTSLLLRYRVSSVAAGTNATGDSLIFRDGLTIQRLSDGLGGCWVVRGSAVPETLRNLSASLARNQVGVQQGNCASEPPGELFVERELTWFGRGGRQNTYTIGTALGELCPLGTREIDEAVNAVLGTTLNRQLASTCP